MKDIPMLSMDSHTFAEDLAAAIGIKPGESVQIVTPQFERTDDATVPIPVEFTRTDWENLHTRTAETLEALGLGIWKKDEKRTHWLYPKEWYWLIPDGLPIVSINGERELFKRGETDDDYRFGCLSFGFIQEAS